ncbi:hypothetical protein [Lonepinella sp. BR2474]|uniref:hypothetical protein n=1 Tax=Lonepinella sp. BR2474 TaxID=3434548 RepID=UPI003F6E1BA5
MAKSYDWLAIKVQFINSNLPMQDFAEQNGIPYGTLRKKAGAGKWLDERITIGSQTEQKSIEFSVNNRATKLAQVDDDCVKTAELINKKVIELLPSIDSPMALKALSGTLKDTQIISRLALGASTENQATGTTTDFAQWLENIDNGELGTSRSSA